MAMRQSSTLVSTLRAVCVAGMAVALTACGGSSYPDLDKFMADTKARPSGHVPPIPAFTTYKNFLYGAAGLRSPFQPPIEVKDITRLQRLTKVRPDPNRTREFLEQFTFDSLGMVGTVQMGGTLWALVSDPEGSVHRVRMGNYVGKNHGRIVELTESYVAAIEIVANGPDEWVERPRKLQLRTAGGGIK
jgi:type IV pilus assembly protein PilP